MEFFYTGEQNWKHAHNTKPIFTKLIIGWEKWITQVGAIDMVGDDGNVIKATGFVMHFFGHHFHVLKILTLHLLDLALYNCHLSLFHI
jgi:hypothetical protein